MANNMQYPLDVNIQLDKKNIQSINVENLPISSEAIIALNLIKKTRILLWIAKNHKHMEMLYQSINTLKNSDQLVHLYKPYDNDPVEVAQHFQLVDKLSKNQSLIVISCDQFLNHYLPSKNSIEQNLITLKVNSKIEQKKIIDWHLKNGFENQVEVYSKGDIANRGAIFDCWPANSDYPVRIEFFDNNIESIRLFDSQTQCSLEKISSIQIPSLSSNNIGKIKLIDLLGSSYLIVNNPESNSNNLPIITDYKYYDLNLRIVSEDILPSKTELDRKKHIINLCEKINIGYNIHFYFESLGSLNRFKNIYKNIDNFHKINLHDGIIFESSINESKKIIIITESDFYNYKLYKLINNNESKYYKKQERISEAADIQPGDYVVHVEHGIGKYLGIVETSSVTKKTEVLSIEYSGGDKVYLPVTQAHLLTRYKGGKNQTPKLHSLKSKKWSTDKLNAEESTKDLASQLLETQALRKTKKGFAFQKDTGIEAEFEASFAYKETPDQITSTEEIKQDMQKNIPMDRLLCGDVGFGKTEVAMRCAFKAVTNNKQVAVLVPTTILAQQHYESFNERMTPFSIHIEMMSRFRTKSQQKKIIEDTFNGNINILIGTHRILSSDINFKDLGLIIIDEEQRFGVKAKEKLKLIKNQIDILTMTATPIPRTLYMSITGVRDLSTIKTAPHNRQPVNVTVTNYDENVIEKAIKNEISRDGQIFYLHNRVKTIYAKESELKIKFPNLNICVAHGQMNEEDLSTTMNDFALNKFDILLCTTIIENGVDIPNCNTIIIENAERFGLSELHQLKGRVGRSNNKAFAYFLTSHGINIADAAKDRINAIKNYTGLGSGLKIASRDLEIRGFGNLLGSKQSGHISAVGFDLYCQLLKRTIAIIKRKPVPPLINISIQIDFLNFSPSSNDKINGAFIPYDFIEDENLRLRIYQRISLISDIKHINLLKKEIRDRFGNIPLPLNHLFLISKLRILGSKKEIQSIRVNKLKVMLKKRSGYYLENGYHPMLNEKKSTKLLKELIAKVNEI